MMNIHSYYLSSIIGGPYKLVLDGYLMYFTRYINSVFMKEQFDSFFEELRLELYFKTTPKSTNQIIGNKKTKFQKEYEQLPITRFFRKHKRIVVRLRAPELTERFDKLNDSRNLLIKLIYPQNTFHEEYKSSVIPERYKNLGDADLARMIVDRYLEAGRLIAQKLKPEDNFDHNRYEQILLRIKDSISDEFLKQMNIEQDAERKRRYLNSALNTRETRRKSNKYKNNLIKEISVFTFAFVSVEKPASYELNKVLCGKLLSFNHPSEILEPYAYRYGKIFYKVLRRKKLLCPDYTSLSILAAKNEEDALIGLAWCNGSDHCGIATFDYERYKTLAEIEKERVVFDIFCQGLRDYVELDKLDSKIIEEAIKEIEVTIKETELRLLDKPKNVE